MINGLPTPSLSSYITYLLTTARLPYLTPYSSKCDILPIQCGGILFFDHHSSSFIIPPNSIMLRNIVVVATILSSLTGITLAFQPSITTNPIIAISNRHALQATRRQIIDSSLQRREIIDSSLISVASLIATTINPLTANAAAAVQDSLEVEEFLRTGVDVKF